MINHHCDQKNFNNKNVLLNSYSSMKKKQKASDDFWPIKLTLKVKFWHFLTPPILCQFEKENDFISLMLISSQKPFYFCIPLLKTSQPVLPYLPWIQKSIPKTLLPINLSTIALKRKCNFLLTEFQFWNIFVYLIVFWDSWPS